MDYAGRIAFVTGASRGIGRDIAIRLARCGADVAVASRDQAEATATAAELEALGVRSRGYACDVSSFADADRVGKAILKDFGSLDFLVSNAGITRDKLILRMTPEDWNEVISTNLNGAYNVVKVFSAHFVKQRRGKIVTISSVIGLTGNAGQTSYAASKAGIIGFTRSLAKELASRGITVNAVAPGYIDTAMTKTLSEDLRQKMLEMIPLKRFGTGEDVAKVVTFLLSDLADYVTGQVINCDGGMVMA